MNYKDFLDYIKKNMEEYFGSEARVSIESVLKNNNIRLDGLVIFDKNKGSSPAIYLNEFYEQYKKEVGIGEILEQIIEMYDRYSHKPGMNFSCFADYERIKDRIVFKLISRDENRELLKQVPHDSILDLAICYGVFLPDIHSEKGLMVIRNCHLAMWKISKEEIRQRAKENTPVLLKPEFLPIEDIIDEIMEDYGIEEKVMHSSGMYVLTNKEKFYGAACMLYEGMMADIAQKLGGDLYILPSSVHELIIVPQNCGMSKWDLMDMVKSVNDDEVGPQEILSYMVYEYDWKNDIIHL